MNHQEAETAGAEKWAGAIVSIAYCPEHGLHGLCFECGKPVEQVLARVLAAREDWIAERSDVEKERDELRAALAVREHTDLLISDY